MQDIINEVYPREEVSNEKITKYIILTESHSLKSFAISKLCESVTNYIKIGWQPQGGVFVIVNGSDYSELYTVCQAMVK